MVAVFTGNGLGLFNTSLTQLGTALGGSSGLGQGTDRQYVNLATGNLLLQARDEFLTFRGLGAEFNRTYNSRGLVSDVGTDGWVTGFERRVTLLSGTFNAAGSVMRRFTGDGAYQDFTYVSSNTYQSTGGDGAHDTLSWTNSGRTWTYVEGSTRREEQYADHASATLLGRLTRIRDLKSDGTTPVTWDVVYNGSNRITELRANNGTTTGDALLFAYDGSGRLSGVSTRENGTVKTQVTYSYDTQGRLTSVITDLTPDSASDNTWDGTTPANNNGKLFRTDYTYEGTSLRLASLTQSDGTLISYTYYADGRVKTVTRGDSNINDADGLGETVTYTYGSGSTTVADSLGRTWTYAYDASGQLTQVTSPAIAGQSDVTTYQYDTAGNATQIKTVHGATTLSQVDYQYDASGNATWEWDALGNAISRTYSGSNQLLTETRYTGVDPDRTGATLPTGGMTTNYIYDTQNRVRFVVNPLGEVSELTYDTSGNGIGQQNALRQYLGEAYTGTMTLSALTSWATNARKANSTLSSYAYDAWGRLSQRTDFAAVDTAGAGTLNGATAIVRYTYDAQGLLRQQITVRGTARTLTGAAPSGSELTDYAYDGMGRLLSVLSRDSGVAASDATSVQTTYTYLDSTHQLVVTSDTDVIRTEVRNAAGRLLSASEVGNAGAGSQTRATTYAYDSAGQLRITQDAGGGRSFFFYDDMGRLEATVDATGAVNRTTYDGDGRTIQTRAFANRVTTTAWASVADLPAGFLAIGVVEDAILDRVTTTTYDAAGRKATEIDGRGALTTYFYDGASRLVGTSSDAPVWTPEDGNGRHVRYFYDQAGRLIATLDGMGYLTESIYDLAGRVIRTVRYATATDPGLQASGTLAQLRPTAAADDIRTRNFYDGRGNLIGVLDAEGYLTTYVFDEAGNIRGSNQYRRQLTGLSGNESYSVLLGLAEFNDVDPGEPVLGIYVAQRNKYDALGRLSLQREYVMNRPGLNPNPSEIVTAYTYDEAGRLIKTEAAQGTTEVRENNLRYNAFGELIGELGGEGSIHLLPGMSEAQLDAVYAQYGVRHSYDALGRRIESIDAEGNKTWYFHDSAGRTTFTVKGVADANGIRNALGEVTESRYTAFGDVSESLAYTGRISVGTPGDRASVAAAIGVLSYVAQTDTRRQYAYNGFGALASVIDSEGSRTDYTYNKFGDLVREDRAVGTTDASSRTYSYDERGLLRYTIDLGGTVEDRWSYRDYDAFGRTVKLYGSGKQWDYSYDRLGRQIGEHVAFGREESWTTTYDAYDRVLTVTDPAGEVTTYVYDDVNRSMTMTSPEGVSIVTTHNRHGEKLTVTDGMGQTTSFEYNLDGQLVETTDALQKTSSNEYDVRGLLAATVDESGRRIEFHYDAVGRVLQRVEDPGSGHLGLTTSYAYDGQGRQLSVTDPSGRTVGYRYDREGRLVETAQDPNGLNYRTAYAYDAQGRQVTVTEGYGSASPRVTQYAYDALGRRISETVDPAGLGLTTSYVYADNDKLIRRTDANGGVTRYFYDYEDRLTLSVDPVGAVKMYGYDESGRLSGTKSAVNAVDPAALSDSSTLADAVDLVNWNNATDIVEGRIYDKDGRLRFVVDVAANYLCEFTYDAANRIVAKREYANVDLPGSIYGDVFMFGSPLKAADIDVTSLRNDAQDRVTWQVYDALGRVRYTVDGSGGTQETFYDASGIAVGTRRYAAPVALDSAFKQALGAGTASLSDVSARLSADDTKDLRGYAVFDAAGRLRYSLDALGAVTETLLDADGRVVGMRRYASAISVDGQLLGKLQAGTATVSDLQSLVVANDALDQRDYQVYDAAGRLRFSIDAQGNIRELRYDAAGRIVQELAYAAPVDAGTLAANLSALKAGTAGLATVANWVAAQEAFARLTVSVWDAAGRLRYSLARTAANAYQVSEFRYDGANRLVAEVVYGKTIPANTAASVTGVASAISSAGGDLATNQRQTRYVYDAAGHRRFTMDNLGGVTESRFDTLGRETETRRYGQFASGIAANEAGLSGWAAAQTDVRTTVKHYDSVGRVVQVTDAAQFNEYFAYDGVGNRVSYTNKLNQTYTYEYDAAGRLVEETSPEVSVATLDAYNQVVQTVRSLVTRTVYDALGNVSQRIEDADGGAPRVTEYAYDNRGHQIRTTFPDAGKWSAASESVVATGIRPTIEVTYDTLGRAVVEKDVLGNYRQRVYDVLGQLAYEVDQEGYVTGYTYNTYGEQVGLTRYATSIGVTSGTPMTQVPVVANAADRALATSYDSLGQKIEVRQSEVVSWTSTHATETRSPTTRFTYDAYGQLIRESVLLEGDPASFGARWADTLRYYDAVGQNVFVVNPEGYATALTFNAQGEVTEQTEYARALTGTIDVLIRPSAPATGDAVTGFDRITRFGYDALGRKTDETAVRHVRTGTDPASVQLRDVLTHVDYDAEGHALTTTVDGVATQTQYDALGRVVSVTEAARQVVRDDAMSQLAASTGTTLSSTGLYETVSPYSTMAYDAFGNVVELHRYAKGQTAGVTTQDQVHLTRYDWQGRAVWERDEAGAVYTRTYDAADHVLESRFRLDGNDNTGRWATIITSATYDRAGRQKYSLVMREQHKPSGAVASEIDGTSFVRYNAFGEIEAKAEYEYQLSDATKTLRYEYDNAGRMVRSNESGSWRDYGYNLAGQQVREEHQVRLNGTQEGVVHQAAVTWQTLDRLGRILKQDMPAADNGAATTSVQQRYDRWGNVVSMLGAIGGLTTVQYNDMDQAIVEVRPRVRVVHADGSEVLETPTVYTFYDALGRVLSTRDANGNVRSNTIDSVGRVTASTDGANATTRYAYDGLGQQVLTQNALDYLTFQTYDKGGRVVAQGDFLVNGTGRTQNVRESYVLNQAGNRLSVTDALGNRTRYEYDSRGLVLRSESAAGVVMEYAYDVQGHKIRETNGLSDPVGLLGEDPPLSYSPVAIPNHDFESGTTGWVLGTGAGATLGVVSGGYGGGNALRLIGTGESQDGSAVMETGMMIEPGRRITATAMVKMPTGTYGTGYALVFVWLDANGNELPRTVQPIVMRGQVGVDWRQGSFTATAPAGAASVKLGIYLNASNSSTTSQVWVDNLSWNLSYGVPTDGRTAIVDDENETVYRDEQTWDYDAFGRLVDHNDLSGIDYDYSYDAVTGQLVGQHNGWTAGGVTSSKPMLDRIKPGDEYWDIYDGGAPEGLDDPTYNAGLISTDRETVYYANGLLKEIRETTPSGTNWTRYTYDAAGNRTSEETLTHDGNGLVVHLRTDIRYDTHNRIIRVTQTDLGASPTKGLLDLRYDYDAMGNRRRVQVKGGYGTNQAAVATSMQPPQLVTPLGPQRGVTGAEWVWSIPEGAFHDPENGTLAYEAVLADGSALPAWLTFDAATHTFHGTPPNDLSISITVTVYDLDGMSVSDTFTFTAGPNLAPVVQNAQPDIVTYSGLAWNYTVPANTFKDPENGALTYSATLEDGSALPSWLTFNAATHAFSGNVPSAGVTLSIRVSVTDPYGASVSDVFQLQATQSHLPLNLDFELGDVEWNRPSGWSIQQGSAYSGSWLAVYSAQGGVNSSITSQHLITVSPGQAYTVSAAINCQGGSAELLMIWLDGNGAMIKLDKSSLVQGGSWVTASKAATAPAGAVYLQIGVSAQNDSGEGPILVDHFTVQEPAPTNYAPVAHYSLPAQYGTTSQSWSYQVPGDLFTDPEGGTLTYSATLSDGSALPSWMSFDPATRTFSGQLPSQAVSLSLRIIATDDHAQSTGAVFTLQTSIGNGGPDIVLENPGFENGLTGWTSVGGTWTTGSGGGGIGPPTDGTQMAWFDPPFGGDATATLTSGTFAVTAGETLVARVDVNLTDSSFTSYLSGRIAIEWLNASGAVLGRSSGNTVADMSGWNDSSVQATAPTGAVSGRIVLTAACDVNYGGSGVIGFDAVHVERLTSGGQSVMFAPSAMLIADDGWDGGGGGSGSGTPSDSIINAAGYQEYWYTYDGENRVQVTHGKLSGGQILVSNNGISYTLGYDAAGRATTRAFYQGGAVANELTVYDARDQQTSVSVDGQLRESFAYDEVGRMLKHRTFDGASALKHIDAFQYDADGRVNGQASYGRSSGSFVDYEEGEGLRYLSTVTYNGYDAGGRSLGYTYYKAANETGVDQSGAPVGFSHNYTYEYEGRESYLEKKVLGSSTNTNFKASQSTSTYDAWGRRILVKESTPGVSTVQTRTRAFAYDMAGEILQRTETGAATQRYAYANGQQVASGMSTDTAGTPVDVLSRLTGYQSSEVGAYQTTVQAGESLRDIAQRVYGNGNLWYVLSEANAITNEELVQGMGLKVPEVKVTANDAATFKPYNPNEAIGNTAPSLPYITPPPKRGCKQLAITLIATVTRVVGQVVGTIVSKIPVVAWLGPIIGAASEFDAQTVERWGGMRDSYDWAAVAIAGVSTLIGGAFARAAQGAGTAARVGYAAASAAANYAASYTINQAFGNEVHFSWRNVAANVATSMVSSAVGGGSNQPAYESGQGFMQSFSWSAVAQQTMRNVGVNILNKGITQAITGQRQDWNAGQLLVDSFGNALGSAIGGYVGGKIEDAVLTRQTRQLNAAASATMDRTMSKLQADAESRMAAAARTSMGSFGNFVEREIPMPSSLSSNNGTQMAGASGGASSGRKSSYENDLHAWAEAYRDNPEARQYAYESDYWLRDYYYKQRGQANPYEIKTLETVRVDGLAEAKIASAAARASAERAALAAMPQAVYGRNDMAELDSIVQAPMKFVSMMRQRAHEGLMNADNGIEAGLLSGSYAVLSVLDAAVEGGTSMARLVTNSNVRSQAVNGLVQFGSHPLYTIGNGWDAWSNLSLEDRLRYGGAMIASFGAAASNLGKAGELGQVGRLSTEIRSWDDLGVANGRPIPRVDVSDAFQLDEFGEYAYMDPGIKGYGDFDLKPHGLRADITSEGVLRFDIAALDDAGKYGSGTDMFASLMSRLERDGVEVKAIQGHWLPGSDNFANYRSARVMPGSTPEQAALSTWTGRIATRYGYSMPEVRVDSINAANFLFRRPKP